MGRAAAGFSPVPSRESLRAAQVTARERPAPSDVALGIGFGTSGPVPAELGLDREVLAGAGCAGQVGQALVIPTAGGLPRVAFGLGDPGRVDVAVLRDAAAAFALAVPQHGALAVRLDESPNVPVGPAAQALVEGVLLARYRYSSLQRSPAAPVTALTVLVPADLVEAAQAGVARAVSFAGATMLSRDLANTPPGMLTASDLADVASQLAAETDLRVEVFDKAALTELGCGGLLGVNAGSAEPPRMIKISYRPNGAGSSPAGRLALVGKGIMYDSGGISLKPSDAVHATMKNDMSGAGAILAAMAVLPELDCPTEVTAYLMCTDNMPSATATKLGDVLTIRGGATVEVINTDAEGRLVMADALVLATESPVDAIVDIATLTGACLRALGADIAGVFGNNPQLINQVIAAADVVDEPVWQLPLARRYRAELNSDIADIKNMGGANGAAIHAALFLDEFVAGLPWAHIDIAGPAQTDVPAAWRPRGCSGFGARLLVEMALSFTAPPR
jgi:leucyl aminopeptidase